MTSRRIGLAILAALCLAGCKKADGSLVANGWDPFGFGHGRYVGLGLYSPQSQWTKIADAAQKGDQPQAKQIDDQVILVVMDSKTGELRACGDLTGYCIGMNPWKTSLTPAQVAPIVLTEHVKPEPVTVTVETKTPPHRPKSKTAESGADASTSQSQAE